ncbi:STAS domain-containing protein [Mucilaginibacter robiniae]|uniref:STAS domain-containing protein n=1 Tax=Mucilaginibacter robiniae TaxID=2728022 RepID=A0A7L5DV35_9SPHI|nr:STAS domain-containing protein [Mucilaginibacter robiniae]QJD94571.1 STAS domain-containing protein [Mucilaginibacter robiniae]
MISISKQANYLVATVNLTEANLHSSEIFKTELISLLNQYQQTIILDLEKITYVDSSFLGALVAVLKHALSLKLDVLLTGLQKDIYDLMKLIRLDKVFKIYKALPEAQYALQ